jgi:aminoglycoside N3'-acetyltransferase
MPETRPYLPIAHVADQLRSLGVTAGGVLLVHSSYRAAGPIEAGPLGLIDAIERALGPGGTLAMPSWTGDDDSPFDPRTTPPASDLGILPQIFWRRQTRRTERSRLRLRGEGPEGLGDRVDAPCPSAAPDRESGRTGAAT